jgi:hypothetical protein
MEDFTFEVNLTAVVRVSAADENVAREVVPAVLGAPGSLEIALANEANAASGRNAQVTDVGFSIASLAPNNGGGDRAVYGAHKSSRPCPVSGKPDIEPTSSRHRADIGEWLSLTPNRTSPAPRYHLYRNVPVPA